MRESSFSMLTRRTALGGIAGLLGAKEDSRLVMQGYIWMNLANRAKRPLIEMMDELFASAPYGRFRNIELNDGYFVADLKSKTLELLDQHKLRMPAVYVGGGMHEDEMAETTLAKALEVGAICKPYGCTAIINNPGSKLKTQAELETQAKNLNRMAKTLADAGFQLRLHNHGQELEEQAREWRHILANTDPKLLMFCLDVEFVFRAGISPGTLIREAGPRTAELHLRNRSNNSPLQSFDDGDIDYAAVARTLKQQKLKPLIVVELAYHDDTIITRPFNENVRMSRLYAEKVFGL